jgi:hypothetical protein
VITERVELQQDVSRPAGLAAKAVERLAGALAKLGGFEVARATGMMDQTPEESNRPTMIGIKLNLSKVEEVIYAKENGRDGSEPTDRE